ncbi:MAG: OmpA family protein [Paracoccaceae bacterium]|nr:OmpA family protein [Paracoccaceae bacterium]
MSLKHAFLTGFALCLIAGASSAQLALPDAARLTVERATQPDSFAAPIGVFSDGVVPFQTVEGSITRRAWRIDSSGLTTLQVIAPLRAQIESLGYVLAFECENTSCGGFDFRFAVEVLPGPNMYVNIAAYRYLTAFKGPRDAPVEAISVLVSVTSASAYVQIIEAVAGSQINPNPISSSASPPTDPLLPDSDRSSQPQSDEFVDQGFAILEDLDFAPGTTDLGAGPFASLERLAATLTERRDLRVALVGHTDTVGALDVNISLSRARARSVRTRLIEEYGIDAGRLDAEGMGYLAPVATNLTAAGRRQNRRVEAVILNVE